MPKPCLEAMNKTKMIAQAFQSTKTNVNLLQIVRFSTHLNIPKEIWISSLEGPSLPHMLAIAAVYLFGWEVKY